MFRCLKNHTHTHPKYTILWHDAKRGLGLRAFLSSVAPLTRNWFREICVCRSLGGVRDWFIGFADAVGHEYALSLSLLENLDSSIECVLFGKENGSDRERFVLHTEREFSPDQSAQA